MELDRTYDLSLLDLEGTVRFNYKNGLENLRKAENVASQMEAINEMILALEKSKGPHDVSDFLEYQKDSILAYKNIGRIILEMNSGEKLEEMINFSQILDKYSIKTPKELEEKLEEAKKYSEMEKTLKKIS